MALIKIIPFSEKTDCFSHQRSFLLIILTLQITLTNVVSSESLLSDWQSPGAVESTLSRSARSLHVDHMTLADQDDLSDSLANNNTPGEPIVSSCAAFIHKFSDAAAAYTRCSILNSRPLRFCEKCVDTYKDVTESFKVIMEGKFHDVTGALCSDAILNSDRIQIVVQTHQFVQHIWDDCHCEGCFTHGDVGYELSNETLHFFELANKTAACFTNYTQTGDPWTWGNSSTVDPAVCESCRPIYEVMNHYYDHVQEENDNLVCMDIVDMMNSTRYEWSQDFHCTQHHVDIVPVVLLTVFFCTTPILFYAAMKIHGAKVEKKLLKQKRLTESLVTSVEEEDIPS